MNRHIAVIMGGWSSERPISLMSGKAVADTLESLCAHVTRIDVTRDLDTLLRTLNPKPDLIFNALHGIGGEDGLLQSIFEILDIPYTHSGVCASATAMNKALTRHIATGIGIRVPQGVIAQVHGLERLSLPIPPPVVIKPIANGSTIGVTLIDHNTQNPILGSEWNYGNKVLIEQYIQGRELTVAVKGDQALAVTEISFLGSLFDYAAKYTSGSTKHFLPAPIPKSIYEAAMSDAVKIHQACNCRGITRSDFRYDDRKPEREGLYFLEINTHPGMTEVSLVPEQARYVGLSFADLITWIVEEAL